MSDPFTQARESLARSLDLIDQAAVATFERSAYNSLVPAADSDIARASADLRFPLPASVQALYSLTSEIEAFDFSIEPLERLPQLQEVLAAALEESANLEAHGLPRTGTVLADENIALTDGNGVFLIVSGLSRVVVFDSTINRFYDAAPSIENLFEAWAAVAQAGLIRDGSTMWREGTIAADYYKLDEIGAVVSTLGCTLASVWVLE